MDDLISRPVRSKDPDQVAAALHAAAAQQQFGVLNVTDLGEKLRAKGVPFSATCRVFDVCRPQAAAAVLQGQMAVAAVLPCRIALYEERGGLHLSTVRPTALLGHFGNPALLEEARRIEADLTEIIEAAATA